MKAFNLCAKIVTVAGQEISVLSLGESGRGRTCVQIPCPQGIQDGDYVEATLAQTKPNGLKTKPSIKRIENEGDPSWVTRISTKGPYIRGARGNVSYDPAQAPSVPVVVAKGRGAFGDAGRVGTWDDLILQVPFGTILRVKPSRIDPYFLLFCSEKVSKLTFDELQLLELKFDLDNRIML